MEDNIDCYKVSDISPFCNSKKKLTFEILEITFNLLIFYPLISNILYAISKNSILCIVAGILTIIYTLVINLIRIKLKIKKLAFILSIISALSFFALPLQEYTQWTLGVYLILELLKSLRKLFKPNYKFYSLSFFFFGEIPLCINLIFAYKISNSYTIFLTILSAIIFALLFLFYLSSSRSTVLIKAEKSYTFNNIKNLTTGSKKVLLMLLFTLLAVILFILLLTNSLNSFINSNIINQITTLLNSANPYSTNNGQYIIHGNSLYIAFPRKNISNIGSENSTNFLSSYTKLILFIFVTIIIFIFLYLLFKRLLELKAKMLTQTNTDTETVFLKEDLKKDLFNIAHKFNFNLSNKEKLRRKYKKLIKSYVKKGLKIQDSSTTNELENEISELTKYNIKNCSDIYRKTRYSPYEPTTDDISKIK